MSNAYRRLSDAHLARSRGSLSQFGTRRKRSEDLAGSGRLKKDYLSPDGDLLEDSSDDRGGSSSEDEGERGRKTARTFEDDPGANNTALNEPRKTLSLLAAAEEERTSMSRENSGV
jgi:hypothetical protein